VALTYPLDQAVAYQINPSHSGAIQMSTFSPPLRKLWSIDLGQPISYPLIAGGKVFVTVRNASSNTTNYGTQLYAFDAATGAVAWGPAPISGTYYWSAAAYENGRVFVLNFDGLLRSFDAQTGALSWTRQLGGYWFDSAPSAAQGIVYALGNDVLWAVDTATGAVLWSAPAYGNQSSPALSDDGAFTSGACAGTIKTDRLTGTRLWSFFTGCTGGGGRTPVYDHQRLYVRDEPTLPRGYLLDAGTGQLISRYQVDPAPAFAGGLGYFLYAGTLSAIDPQTWSTRWSFSGDGSLASAPIVVNRHVYVGSSTGRLYALDASTGVQRWSDNVGAPIYAPDEHNLVQPLTGLGAGEGAGRSGR